MEILSVSRGKWREPRTGRCRVTTGTVVEITRLLEKGKANFPRELRKERLRKVACRRDVNTSQVHAGDLPLEPHKIGILPQESTSSRYRSKWICWTKIQTYNLFFVRILSFHNCRNVSTPTENDFGTHFVTVLLIILCCRILFDYFRTCKLFFLQRCFQSGAQEEIRRRRKV